MANLDLSSVENRKNLVKSIKSSENQCRKANSLKSYEVFNDNAKPFVESALIAQLSQTTVQQMQVISNLNIAKAVVNKEADIYTEAPVRTYEGMSDNDKKAIDALYADASYDTTLGKSNKYFKLHNQTFLQVLPDEGKINIRVLHGHNIDVIPDDLNPERAYAYIISSFDKSALLKSDGVNQMTADADDAKALAERYQVWTKEFVFTMNGRGEYVSDPIKNEIQELPFVDVSKSKDFEFFVRIGQALTDFTIDYNVSWSDLLFTARMQGYSVGVVTGNTNLIPKTMTVGPNKLIFFPMDPLNPEGTPNLEFKSANPAIEAVLKTIDSLVSVFLTTRGLDAKAVSSNNSGKTSYSSALERLLAMLDQFKASKEDFDLYKGVENKLHKIVTKYMALLSGTTLLDKKYWTTKAIESSELKLNFARPEMVETKSEQIANEKSKIDLGISDRVEALAKIDGISEEEALKRITILDARKPKPETPVIPKDPEVPNVDANKV